MRAETFSIILLAYNQEAYIEEAVRGVLAQDCDSCEIILSDDCSTDRTFELMSAIVSRYVGPHSVILNRNHANVGLSAHFKKAVGMSSGRWIVCAAGDDISLPSRVRVLARAISANPHIAGIASHYHNIDKIGKCTAVSLNDNSRMRAMQNKSLAEIMRVMRRTDGCFFLLGAAAAWRRDVFEVFQPLPDDKSINEDFILLWRALILGGAHLIEDDLVGYRRHSSSLSANPLFYADLREQKTQQRKKLIRSRASFMFTLNDLLHARSVKLISAEDYEKCVFYLRDYIDYQTALIDWGSMSLLQRIMAIAKFWRPNYLRPGLRKLFSR